MLANTLLRIKRGFNVEFHDYNRLGNSVLVTSGFGIGLAMMDILSDTRYLLDLDNYRHRAIDWEAIAVMISCAKPNSVFMTGYFTLDSSLNFEAFKRGVINTPLFVYLGNNKESLAAFVQRAGVG